MFQKKLQQIGFNWIISGSKGRNLKTNQYISKDLVHSNNGNCIANQFFIYGFDSMHIAPFQRLPGKQLVAISAGKKSKCEFNSKDLCMFASEKITHQSRGTHSHLMANFPSTCNSICRSWSSATEFHLRSA